jgi:hypothetical protein
MAHVHEGKSRLEFYLGGPGLPREDPVQHFALEGGDILLLCSDGVSGPLWEAQIRDVLADPAGDLEQMADRLIEAATAAGETDNQTIILWRQPPSAAAVEPAATAGTAAPEPARHEEASPAVEPATAAALETLPPAPAEIPLEPSRQDPDPSDAKET